MKSRLHQLMLCQKITCSTSVLITAGLLACFLRPAQLVGRVWDDLPVYWELLYVKENMLQNIHIYLLSWLDVIVHWDNGQTLLSLNAVWLEGTTAVLTWYSYQVHDAGQKKKMYFMTHKLIYINQTICWLFECRMFYFVYWSQGQQSSTVDARILLSCILLWNDNRLQHLSI